MLRKFLETTTQSWTFRRQLPASFGSVPIIATPSGGLKYLFKGMSNIDPMLLKVCDEIVSPGSVVWDIGTNVGLFSVASSVRATSTGKVFSFEPDVWLVQLLRQTASLQPATSAPIDVLPVGVAEKCGFMRFAIAKRARAANHLEGFGTNQTGGVRQWNTIFCVNMDWLAEQITLPTVIKIDVEGAEKCVLEGAKATFEKCRPSVFVEVAEANRPFVTGFFTERNYKLFDGDRITEGRMPIDHAVANTLAIPK